MSYINNGWRSGMQAVSQAIDDAFGEPLEIIPCHQRPNNMSTPYCDEAITLRGVISQKPNMAFDMTRNSLHSRVQSYTMRATFSRLDLPWPIERGDRIRRRCDGELYEVTAVRFDGSARVECELKQMGKPEQ